VTDAELRTAVRDAVAGRTPVDDRERASIVACLDALDRLPAPFDRNADPVHVTGSGIVTGRRGVLLLLHRRLHIWVQPGGHVEAGETPWAAARRESEEETGLELRLVRRAPDGRDVAEGGVPRLVHVDVHPAGEHTHLDLRYALTVVGDDEPRPPEGESPDVVWYAWPDAIATADAGLAGLLRHLASSAEA
jgi:8-oxo-dGTP pyrophosphatase MutT (NUDIX family)